MSPLIDIDVRIAKLRDEIDSGKATSPTVQVELALLLEERNKIIQKIGRQYEGESPLDSSAKTK